MKKKKTREYRVAKHPRDARGNLLARRFFTWHIQRGGCSCKRLLLGKRSRRTSRASTRRANRRLGAIETTRHCRLRQCYMAPVGRVKCATEDADTLGNVGQTQSLRTRNCSYRAASGVPGAGIFWYDQLASGGMDSKIDSVRPPDCKPKCVPRSHTKLNST